MRPSLYPLEDVMPHRGKMLLLDEIVEFDRGGEALTAAFHGRKEWRGGFAAIEYMAQAAAARGPLTATPDGPVRRSRGFCSARAG